MAAIERRANSSSRKIRETLKAYLDEPHLVDYIGKFKDGLWPGGQLKPPSPPRTTEERLRTRDEANRKLSALMPGECPVMTPTALTHRRAFRLGRKYDRPVECAPRSTTDICRFAESTAQSTPAVHDC